MLVPTAALKKQIDAEMLQFGPTTGIVLILSGIPYSVCPYIRKEKKFDTLICCNVAMMLNLYFH